MYAHVSKIKQWHMRWTVRTGKIGIDPKHGCASSVWAAPPPSKLCVGSRAIVRQDECRTTEPRRRVSAHPGYARYRDHRGAVSVSAFAVRRPAARVSQRSVAIRGAHVFAPAPFLRHHARPPLPSSAVRLADSHSPPMDVRRCGRRGPRRNPRCARVLHCVPVPGATQSVAWDASGL
jgi:hypothetical protein